MRRSNRGPEATSPAIEAARPATDAASPAIEAACPAVEAACPATEARLPAIEAARPAIEAACPATETTRPAIEAASPAATDAGATATEVGAAPTTRRIAALDALRGFALCGIVFINIPQTMGMMHDLSQAPGGVRLLVLGRFYPIFYLLFGLFLRSAARRTGNLRVPMARRLLVLGVLHHLLQPGEVLLPFRGRDVDHPQWTRWGSAGCCRWARAGRYAGAGSALWW